MYAELTVFSVILFLEGDYSLRIESRVTEPSNHFFMERGRFEQIVGSISILSAYREIWQFNFLETKISKNHLISLYPTSDIH